MRRPALLFAFSFVLVSLCVAAENAAMEPPAPSADGTMPALVSIAGHGMMDAHPYQDLEEVSDTIGGGVTGSPQAAKAIEWGVAKMKAIGLENVHTEKWQLSRGWTRVSASDELLSPVERRLNVDSMGWVGSTPAHGVAVEGVTVNASDLDTVIQTNAS